MIPPLLTGDGARDLTALVTLLALLVYIYLGLGVSAARDRFGVAPPAMTGPPEFERAVRIHQNTLEALPVFLTTLWLAAMMFRPLPWLAAALGLVWILGRVVFAAGYARGAAFRAPGLILQTLAILGNMGLVVAALVLHRLAAQSA